MNPLLLSLLFFCTAYMTGVIWFVQLIKYPMLGPVTDPDFATHHQEYTRRMGWVVGPVMILEMALQVVWMVQAPGLAAYSGGSLLSLIWISTFALQVPLHERLAREYQPRWHRQLVHTNWIRTLAWTLRSALLIATLS